MWTRKSFGRIVVGGITGDNREEQEGWSCLSLTRSQGNGSTGMLGVSGAGRVRLTVKIQMWVLGRLDQVRIRDLVCSLGVSVCWLRRGEGTVSRSWVFGPLSRTRYWSGSPYSVPEERRRGEGEQTPPESQSSGEGFKTGRIRERGGRKRQTRPSPVGPLGPRRNVVPLRPPPPTYVESLRLCLACGPPSLVGVWAS